MTTVKTVRMMGADGSVYAVQLTDTGLKDDNGAPIYRQATNAYPRPIDLGVNGSYRFDAITGTMAAGLAAAAPIFSFRWGSTTKTCLIHRVQVSLMSLGTGFAVGQALLELMIARAFTGSDSAGTPVSLTTNQAKKRTSFGTSLVTDARISSTGALTVGTRTLDTLPYGVLHFGITAAINTVFLQSQQLGNPDIASGEWPIVLAQDEGIVIRATVPATGTWTAHVAVDWDEVDAY